MKGARWIPRWPVRTRILATILVVTAAGMLGAGLAAFVVQRHSVLLEVDDELLSRVEAARIIVTGAGAAAGGEETSAANPPPGGYTTAAEAVQAVLSRVIPDAGESAVGIVDGRAAYVPGVQVDFHLEDDPAFIQRVIEEVADDTVRMGTAVSPLGPLRYVATPILVGEGPAAIYVAAVDLDDALRQLYDAFGTYATLAAVALALIGLIGWFVAGRLLAPNPAAARGGLPDHRERAARADPGHRQR